MKFFDGLRNVITGLGGRTDARHGNSYYRVQLDQMQIENAFRGSGMIRKVIEIPAEDCIREWREWQADSAQIALLASEEKRLGIQAKTFEAEVLRGLGGGAFILGLAGDPALPPPATAKGGLSYLHVVSRYQLTLGQMVDDPLDPLHGGPAYFTINGKAGMQRIHPKRVVCFKGDTIPYLSGSVSWEDMFWGESRIARIMNDAENFDTAKSAFANLLSKASVMRIGIPKLFEIVQTSGGEAALNNRLRTMQAGQSVVQSVLYDKGDPSTPNSGEDITDATASFAGAKDMMSAFGLWLAASADIPATRLLGQSATGMNASGDGEQKDWNKQVKARQTLKVAPCLDELDFYLIPSALGSFDPALSYSFPPLDMPSPADEAVRFKTIIEAVTGLQDTGTIPDDAMAKGVQSLMVEEGWLPGLEAALAELSDDERYGITGTTKPDDLTLGGGDPVSL